MEMTKENVAAALNVYECSAEELLTGVVCIRYGEVKELAYYFGVTPAEVLRDNPGLRLMGRK